MKKLLLTLILLGLLSTPALATQSLGWWQEGATNSTHQYWDFTPGYIKASGAGYTAVPESVISPYPNRVLATIIGGTWDGSSSITSSTAIYVSLEIPNYEQLNAYKEIWVDIGNAVASDIAVSATDGGSMSFTYEILAGQGDSEFGVRIWPNPYVEKIDFVIYAPATGGLAVLDYIHVDTICIPAPGAILLGGIGVALVGWLRGRRTL